MGVTGPDVQIFRYNHFPRESPLGEGNWIFPTPIDVPKGPN